MVVTSVVGAGVVKVGRGGGDRYGGLVYCCLGGVCL